MAIKRSNIFKIGITGNICTGKNLVLNTLQRAGVQTLSPEKVVMGLLIDNPNRLEIRLSDHFGSDVLDSRGRLSHRKLMTFLFRHPDKKALFDTHMDPLIRDEIKRFLYSPIGYGLRAVEASRLLETDTQHLYDEIWMVTANPSVQRQRLIARDGLTPPEAQYLIDSQWSQEKKAALCHRVIDNSGEIQETEALVRKVLDETKTKAHSIGF